jgi:hypothetical protein
MYFEDDFELDHRKDLVERFFVYVAKKKNDPMKNREIFQVSLYYSESNLSFFYKLHLTRVFSQYQVGGKTIRSTDKPKIPASVGNTFTCVVSKKGFAVKFGPVGNLGMLDSEYRNRGLGRFCMAYLVRKIKLKGFGSYGVVSPSLSIADAQERYDKLVRNYFYKNSGFNFNSINIKSGTCSVSTVSGLTSNHNRSKVKIIKSERAIDMMLNTVEVVSNLEKRIEILQLRDYFNESNYERVKNKYSVSICILSFLLIYIVWVSPLENNVRVILCLFVSLFSYFTCAHDIKNLALRYILKSRL